MHKLFTLASIMTLSACSTSSDVTEAGRTRSEPLDESEIIIECAIADEDGYCSCPPCEPPPPKAVPETDSRFDCLDGCKPPPPPPPSALRVVEGVCGAHERPETDGCKPRSSIYEVTEVEFRLYEERYALGLGLDGEPVELPRPSSPAPEAVGLPDPNIGPLGLKSDVDLTGGVGPFFVREAEGGRNNPETCRWNPFWSAWQCSNVAGATQNWRVQDGISWFSLHRSDGSPLYPQKYDGTYTLVGDGDSGYSMQLGFGLMSSPLGFAIGALGETYAIEAAQLVPPEPYLEVPRRIVVMDAFGQYVGEIEFPAEARGINDCTLAPDLENGGQALYCTEAGFYQEPAGITAFAPRCIIYKIATPQIPALATVTKWLDTAALECKHANPIDYAPVGGVNKLFFATLGPLDTFTGGFVYSVDMSTKALTKLNSPPPKLYDGLAVRRTAFGGSTSYDLVVSGIFDRKVTKVYPNSSAAQPAINPPVDVLDLSSHTRQVAGMGCKGNWGGIPGSAECAFGSNRETILIAKKR